MKPIRLYLIANVVFATAEVHAASINMNADDANTTPYSSSFDTGLHWVGGGVPAAGNDYFNANFLLRTPTTVTPAYTFGGNSLTITSDSALAVNLSDALMFKGLFTGNTTITINNLTINGGNLRQADNDDSTFTLAGNGLTVGPLGMGVHIQGPTVISAPVGGSGIIRIVDNGSNAAGRILHFSNAANTFTGNVELPTANRSRFQVNAGSNFNFVIGAPGVNNTITGAGSAAFNGAFNLDLTAASTAVGSSWTLVAATTLAETYDAAFTIPTFTSDAGVAGARLWTKSISGSTFYRYNEATGVLSVIQTDTDADNLSDLWEDQYFGNNDGSATVEELALQSGTGDADGDGASNLAEQAAGTNPNSNGSWPDVDADTLKDAWEITYFGNIAAQGANGDFDGDLVTNSVEFASGTFPNNAASWPDTEPDSLNDAWEVKYFTNLGKDGSLDSDLDSFSDFEEHEAHTHPNSIALSPITSTLKHRWSFNGSLADSVGGSDATVVDVGGNDVAYNSVETPTGITMSGGLRTASDYVKLGANLLPKDTSPVTIELWAKQNTIQNWSRIFDFHASNAEYLMMSWTQGVNDASDQAEVVDGGVVNNSPNKNQPYGITDEYHIVMTLQPLAGAGGNMRVTFYSAKSNAADLGPAKGTFDTAVNLVNLNDLIDALGYSPWTGDNTASATYNEVRIWNGALFRWVREKLHDQGPENAAIPDSDNDFLPDDWEYAYFPGNLTALATGDDADLDGTSNRDEYIAGSAPNSDVSTPEDTDADGLLDTWELAYFANVAAQDGAGDPDLDGFTNEEEETNGTHPASDDNDGDGLGDNWETTHFGNWPTPGQADPLRFTGADDPDGDTHNNEAEETAGSSPTVAISIPADIDADGLLDIWEDKYFGDNNGTASLAELALQSGAGDPDLDTYHNEAEETAKSNPGDITSIPGDVNGDGLADGHLLLNPDILGTTSFATGLNWDNATAPVAGQNYLVGVNGLRTVDDANPYTFAGDRLVFTTGGQFIVKGTGVITVPYLGLDGGWVANATNANVVFTLAGAIHVTRASSILCNNNGIIVDAGIGGNKELTISGVAGRIVTLNAVNTFTGNLQLTTAGITLGSAGSLRFAPGATTVTNVIAGTGPATLNGALNIDLGGAGNTAGDNWDLITTTGLVTYGPTFTVTGFTADAGAVGARKWTSGNYQFDEADGVLTRLAAGSDSDNDGMPDSWETTYFPGLGQSAADDFDKDGTSNLTEYRLGLTPNSGTSRFAATRAPGGLITWPSAVGLTFDVQRSTVLAEGSWTTVSPLPGGISGAAGTSSFTDPSPPVGNAFYKVVLRP
ncbi:MAG: hypothetical protein V4689_16075 [Verrucomicrobiota bacterium]